MVSVFQLKFLNWNLVLLWICGYLFSARSKERELKLLDVIRDKDKEMKLIDERMLIWNHEELMYLGSILWVNLNIVVYCKKMVALKLDSDFFKHKHLDSCEAVWISVELLNKGLVIKSVGGNLNGIESLLRGSYVFYLYF